MARATNAPQSRKRRKRLLRDARGFRGRRSKLFRYAKDALYKARYWSYRDRKNRKREFRALWIQRINAACRKRGMTYSRFMEALRKAGIGVNRKMLAELAVRSQEDFDQIFKLAKEGNLAS
ncbi:50S ribosomal protein L20 [Candidatus Methylacidiphilum infernorum]|uniref:Large ribosomal subunit protein bL20 n=1 Tax=Methylacidiphilum infernorum (isolate V4) TaxID=481448 RepID=RL20_METI4|nr:50S ribosomal protein L20 [Candidatus Methylacidiphilum infernorum]B3DYH9.1 RecName: Full=Large ribosomal subunit protein bL20; AltName: Full=50S ribosomal protein L20 [Methylacidiphilum infernorum V4]ACD84027.1 Ribosomal protein L20 [Methylacidiphilum infernorum V4]